MRVLGLVLLASACAFSSDILAFDLGPVHIHGTKFKVGDTMDMKILITRIVRDDEDKDRIRKLEGHRKGDDTDSFKLKVVWSDLDDDSKELLKAAKEDTVFKLKVEKLDDDWKLVKIRKNDED